MTPRITGAWSGFTARPVDAGTRQRPHSGLAGRIAHARGSCSPHRHKLLSRCRLPLVQPC